MREEFMENPPRGTYLRADPREEDEGMQLRACRPARFIARQGEHR
jgi:hypothetical protein